MLAERAGVHPVEVVIDRLIESEGHELFNMWFFNRAPEALGDYLAEHPDEAEAALEYENANGGRKGALDVIHSFLHQH